MSNAGMGYPEPIRHSYPNMQTPELDPKDERLQELAQKIGYLEGRNSVLERDSEYLRDLLHAAEVDLNDVRGRLSKVEGERDEYRSDYWEYKREAENLRQYKPKEGKTDEGNDLPSSES